MFLFVEPSAVAATAERFGATPFDVEGVFWSHRGDTCTFDTVLAEFGLKSEALDRLAAIVRGADTARLDLPPQAARRGGHVAMRTDDPTVKVDIVGVVIADEE